MKATNDAVDILSIPYGSLIITVATTYDSLIAECENGNTTVSIRLCDKNTGISWVPYYKARDLIGHLENCFGQIYKGKKSYSYEPSQLASVMTDLLKDINSACNKWLVSNQISRLVE